MATHAVCEVALRLRKLAKKSLFVNLQKKKCLFVKVQNQCSRCKDTRSSTRHYITSPNKQRKMEKPSEYSLRCQRVHIQERLKRDRALIQKPDISEKRKLNAQTRIESNEKLLIQLQQDIVVAANPDLRQNDEAMQELKQKAFDALKKYDDWSADYAKFLCQRRSVYYALPCDKFGVKIDELGKYDAMKQESRLLRKRGWDYEETFVEILDTIDEKFEQMPTLKRKPSNEDFSHFMSYHSSRRRTYHERKKRMAREAQAQESAPLMLPPAPPGTLQPPPTSGPVPPPPQAPPPSDANVAQRFYDLACVEWSRRQLAMLPSESAEVQSVDRE